MPGDDALGVEPSPEGSGHAMRSEGRVHVAGDVRRVVRVIATPRASGTCHHRIERMVNAIARMAERERWQQTSETGVLPVVPLQSVTIRLVERFGPLGRHFAVRGRSRLGLVRLSAAIGGADATFSGPLGRDRAGWVGALVRHGQGRANHLVDLDRGTLGSGRPCIQHGRQGVVDRREVTVGGEVVGWLAQPLRGSSEDGQKGRIRVLVEQVGEVIG